MSETYTRKLNQGEYNNIFELATSFKGEASIKTAATKVSEKISEAVRAGVTNTVDEEGNSTPVMPESIEVEFTRGELDGFWRGTVEKIRNSETVVREVLIIKAISKALGMSGRFAKFEATEIDLNNVEDDFDVPVVEEPLD